MHEDGLDDDVHQQENETKDKEQIEEIKKMIMLIDNPYSLRDYMEAIEFLLTYAEDFYKLWEAVQNIITKGQLSDINTTVLGAEFVDLCKVCDEITKER